MDSALGTFAPVDFRQRARTRDQAPLTANCGSAQVQSLPGLGAEAPPAGDETAQKGSESPGNCVSTTSPPLLIRLL